MLESGKLVHKIGFDIDSKSWSNLNKFQKRLTQLKAQMKGLNGAIDIKVNASKFKQQAEKVAKIKADAETKVKKNIPVDVSVMEKRERRIANLRERMAYKLSKAGVDSKAQGSFFSAFDRQAGIFKQTGDIQTFTTKVGLASSRMADAARNTRTLSRNLKDMRSTMVAATQAYTAFAAVQNVANTGMQLEGLQAGMKVFAGSDANVRAEFDYIVKQSERMGINFEAAATQYTKFNIVSRNKLDAQQRKEVFEGMSEYATVMQVDAEQYKRAFNAVSQMMSKGTVMS